MDPDATLKSLDEAINTDDCDGTKEFSGYLIDWLEKGGFPPLQTGSDFDHSLDWRLNLGRDEWLGYLHGIRRVASAKDFE